MAIPSSNMPVYIKHVMTLFFGVFWTQNVPAKFRQNCWNYGRLTNRLFKRRFGTTTTTLPKIYAWHPSANKRTNLPNKYNAGFTYDIAVPITQKNAIRAAHSHRVKIKQTDQSDKTGYLRSISNLRQESYPSKHIFTQGCILWKSKTTHVGHLKKHWDNETYHRRIWARPLVEAMRGCPGYRVGGLIRQTTT